MPPKGQAIGRSKRGKVYKALLSSPYARPEYPTLSDNNISYILETLDIVLSNEDLRSSEFCMGFNSVHELAEEKPEILACIFVCRSDIDIPLVTSHFPLLCGVTKIKLVQLPQGSAERLAWAWDKWSGSGESLAMADTSVFALKKPEDDRKADRRLMEIIDDIPHVEVPWNTHKTVIKSLRTTAGISKKERKQQKQKQTIEGSGTT